MHYWKCCVLISINFCINWAEAIESIQVQCVRPIVYYRHRLLPEELGKASALRCYDLLCACPSTGGAWTHNTSHHTGITPRLAHIQTPGPGMVKYAYC